MDKTNYVYSLNLSDGCKYVGRTTNPEELFAQHFQGSGAEWTKLHAPTSVNSMQQCKSEESAKAAERIVYEKMRDYHGEDKVRGAGHTKST